MAIPEAMKFLDCAECSEWNGDTIPETATITIIIILGECNALWGERERSRRQPYLLSIATQTRRRGVQ